jgi:hypothetical protein
MQLSSLTNFTSQTCAPHYTTTATIFDDNHSFVGTFDVVNCTAHLIPATNTPPKTTATSKGMRNIAAPSFKELFVLLLGFGALFGKR